MDITTITNALVENMSYLGFLILMLIYNHFTFNKYQKNLTRQSEIHANSLREAYESANKNVIDKYESVISSMKSHMDYLSARLSEMQGAATGGEE